MLQIIHYGALAGDKTAHRCQRLRERAHHDIDVVQHAQVLGRARAGRAQHADAVRLVHIGARAVGLGQLHDGAQVGDIAFHAEHTFADDENLLVGRAVLQAPLEVLHIAVPEPDRARRRPQRPFHQAGVQVVIADHLVALLGERAEGRVVGLEPGTESNGGFFMYECGEFGFQFYVKIQRAVEKARSAATTAVFLDGLPGGFLHLGMGDQVQIIVGPEHQYFAVPHAHFASPTAFAVSKDLEVHVEPGGLQVTRTSEISAFLEDVVRAAAFSFAGDVASRYAHGPQFQLYIRYVL